MLLIFLSFFAYDGWKYLFQTYHLSVSQCITISEAVFSASGLIFVMMFFIMEFIFHNSILGYFVKWVIYYPVAFIIVGGFYGAYLTKPKLLDIALLAVIAIIAYFVSLAVIRVISYFYKHRAGIKEVIVETGVYFAKANAKQQRP
jgi:hypothetical protein